MSRGSILLLVDIYILLDVLVCSIAVYFYELCGILTSLFGQDGLILASFFFLHRYFDEPIGRVKIQTTSKNIQRYYTPKRLIRDLLSNDFFSQNSDLPRF